MLSIRDTELTLGKIEGDQSLTCVLAVAIDSKSDGSRTTQRAPKADNAKEHSWHDPIVSFLSTPPITHQADTGRNGYWNGHDKSKLGLDYDFGVSLACLRG